MSVLLYVCMSIDLTQSEGFSSDILFVFKVAQNSKNTVNINRELDAKCVPVVPESMT